MSGLPVMGSPCVVLNVKAQIGTEKELDQIRCNILDNSEWCEIVRKKAEDAANEIMDLTHQIAVLDMKAARAKEYIEALNNFIKEFYPEEPKRD